MSDIASESVITALLSTTSALVAVSLAILVVIPAFSRQAADESGRYSGRYFKSVFKNSFTLLLLSVMILVSGSLTGIVGLFFPSRSLAYAIGITSGIGIVLLVIGAVKFAYVVVKSLIR